ncbi:hypothetical protein CC78DRAFT_543555 [Lojkania enalia]|uniref:Phytanoyl-CoA dioxygenase n=1 Tax=Lojkania enalia TaxID=147567 RepID=A0A9P4N0S5_9PLEO|nr:hypothetical protein CC78DRAFT_543555 [Didymosphaeria enalia]
MSTTTPSPTQPIHPTYKPRASISSLPSNCLVGKILSILERDEGIILTHFVSLDELDAIDADIEAYRQQTPSTEEVALNIIPKETLVVPGLVGMSPTVAKMCESVTMAEGRNGSQKCITLHIGYEAPRQRLHQDDNVHAIKHSGKFELNKTSQFGCLIAGSKTTRENGATMFIPGSRKWDDNRWPKMDQVFFAEMEPSSALIFLASCYHGGGHNSILGPIRKMHGLFFIGGTMRTEENQFLAIPRSKALTMSNNMLSLLGYKKPTRVLRIVENEDPVTDLNGVLIRASL